MSIGIQIFPLSRRYTYEHKCHFRNEAEVADYDKCYACKKETHLIEVDDWYYENYLLGKTYDIHVGKDWYGEKNVFAEIYKGRVFASRERNYYDDSDFYGVIWNNGRISTYEYATTRGGGTDGNWCRANLSDAFKPQGDEYLVQWYYRRLLEDREHRRSENAYHALRPEKGREVVVIKGRKVPIGTTGTVFWMGKDGWSNDKIGMRTIGGTVYWTAASNVQTLDPWAYVETEWPTDDALNEQSGK